MRAFEKRAHDVSDEREDRAWLTLGHSVEDSPAKVASILFYHARCIKKESRMNPAHKCVVVVLMVAVVCADMRGGAIASAFVRSDPLVDAAPPSLDARSRLHDLLCDEFVHGGWPAQDAAQAAHWALKNRLKPGASAPPKMPSGATLDARSSVHAMAISSLERQGWDELEASLMVSRLLKEFTSLFRYEDMEHDGEKPEPLPVSPKGTPHLDERSSLHALLINAFEKGGWPAAEASIAATWALRNLREAQVRPAPATPPDARIDARAGVHALLIEEFVEGGWEREAASRLVADKLVEYMAREPADGL